MPKRIKVTSKQTTQDADAIRRHLLRVEPPLTQVDTPKEKRKTPTREDRRTVLAYSYGR